MILLRDNGSSVKHLKFFDEWHILKY
jgi:hypothetical protein